MLLYWEVISYAIERGLTRCDFSRSTSGEGTHTFKAQWGATTVSLSWEYRTGNTQRVLDLSPKNPKYERAIELWKQVPMAVANRLGSPSVRDIP